MPKSYYLCNKMLDAALRNVAYVPPATTYVALFTTSPTPSTAGVEVVGGGYTRQSATYGAPVNGTTDNTTDVTFPIAMSDWGTITSFGVFDAPVGGNLLYFASLSSSRYIATNDQVRFPVGQLIATET